MKSYENKFFEFTPKWGLALCYCRFEEHDSIEILLLWGQLFIFLPWGGSPKCMVDKWGFSSFYRSVMLNWGAGYSKIMDFPWTWQHVRHTVFNRNGDVMPGAVEKLLGEELLKAVGAQIADYFYMLKSGEIQSRKAQYYVEEMEWRWKWFTWLSWPRKVRKSIYVTFDGEVGEETGSWKGGTIGCGYDMTPGETAIECLRRMERKRKF